MEQHEIESLIQHELDILLAKYRLKVTQKMDFIITILRLPFGLIASIVVIGFFLLLFPIESALMVVFLPLGAVFMNRRSFKDSWMASYPNSLKAIPPALSGIWEWVGGD